MLMRRHKKPSDASSLQISHQQPVEAEMPTVGAVGIVPPGESSQQLELVGGGVGADQRAHEGVGKLGTRAVLNAARRAQQDAHLRNERGWDVNEMWVRG